MKKKIISFLLAVGIMALSLPQPNALQTATVSVEKFTLGQGFIVEPTQVELKSGDTCASVVDRVLRDNGISYESSGTIENNLYIVSIAGADSGRVSLPSSIKKRSDYKELQTNEYAPNLAQGSYRSSAGWYYFLNNEMPEISMSANAVKHGDVIRIQFTLFGYGNDLKAQANKDELLRKASIEKNSTKKAKALKVLANLDATKAEIRAVLESLEKTSKPSPKPAKKPAVKPTVKPTQKPAQKPATKETEKPTKKPTAKPTQKPATGDQSPATGDSQPATSDQSPATSDQIPATESPQPATGDYDYNKKLNEQLALLNQNQNQYRSLEQAWQLLALAKATGDSQPATSDQSLSTGDSQPATSDQSPATSDSQPATSDQSPATATLDPQTATAYKKAVTQAMQSGEISFAKSTDYSKLILSLTACQTDCTKNGSIDMLLDLDKLKAQGTNGPIWALIAINSHDAYKAYVDKTAPALRDELANYIATHTTKDKGWSLLEDADEADIDVTAMALVALKPYEELYADEIKQGFDILKNAKYENLEGIAQAIIAHNTYGHDAKWLLNLLSAYDVQQGFSHLEGGALDTIATEQGTLALLSCRLEENGELGIYEFENDLEADEGSSWPLYAAIGVAIVLVGGIILRRKFREK